MKTCFIGNLRRNVLVLVTAELSPVYRIRQEKETVLSSEIGNAVVSLGFAVVCPGMDWYNDSKIVTTDF